MPLFVRVDSIPEGESLLWLREQWVGLVLPLAQHRQTSLQFLASGVLTGPKTLLARLLTPLSGKFVRRAGCKVQATAAVNIVAARSPEAAAWSRENAAHPLKTGRCFVVQQETARVTNEGV
jgi:hypothetical protein